MQKHKKAILMEQLELCVMGWFLRNGISNGRDVIQYLEILLAKLKKGNPL